MRSAQKQWGNHKVLICSSILIVFVRYLIINDFNKNGFIAMWRVENVIYFLKKFPANEIEKIVVPI